MEQTDTPALDVCGIFRQPPFSNQFRRNTSEKHGKIKGKNDQSYAGDI